ncbi:hypothetical protein OAM67_00840 [bacterium]|nr:hypothetical protein [bacterium]
MSRTVSPPTTTTSKRTVTRNLRQVETDGIVDVDIVGYDYKTKDYSVKITINHDGRNRLVKMKMNWEKHFQPALKTLKKKLAEVAYVKLLLNIDHKFSFAPSYKNFTQFRRGKFGKPNHRSVLMVNTILGYIVEQSQHKGNEDYHACLYLLEVLFNIFN